MHNKSTISSKMKKQYYAPTIKIARNLSFSQNNKSPQKQSLRKNQFISSFSSYKQIVKDFLQNNKKIANIVNVMHQKGIPQKCLQHNNYYSLYCAFQKQLLCVNCIYNKSSHKNHKVCPIKNVMVMILNDNQNLNNKLKRKQQFFQKMISTCVFNESILEQNYNTSVFDLKKHFQSIIEKLKQKHHCLQKQIYEQFKYAIQYNRKISKLFVEIKDFLKREIGKIGPKIQPDQQIYKNRLLTSILNNIEKVTMQIYPQQKLQKSFINNLLFKKIQTQINKLDYAKKKLKNNYKPFNQLKESYLSPKGLQKKHETNQYQKQKIYDLL